MPALTSEQQLALRTRDTSVALSAGAGCGKTLVLTERFLAHLQPNDDDAPDAGRLNQLVAITFTEPAAREMRRRIREKCRERLAAAELPRDRAYWLALMRAIETARVSTIHAFCRALLQSHAVAAGVDPIFGVLEQGEADVWVSQAIDDVLRERLAALDGDTMKLAAAIGLSSLKQQLRLLLACRHKPEFDAWQEATPETLVAAWQKFFDEIAWPARLTALGRHRCVRRVLHTLGDSDALPDTPKFREARATLLDILPRLSDGPVSAGELTQLREVAGVQGITTAKEWPSRHAFDAYKDQCTKLRGEIDKCLKLQFHPEAARESAELGLIALRLARDVADAYERRKAHAGRLDFDDLLAAALRLCRDPANRQLQQSLSRDLQLLLVDEFQDTDQLQVDLVQALCGDGVTNGKLFFVGDFKQSIYRFRGAQPEVFHNLRSGIPEPGRLRLSENFRSQPGVLHFVNALFGKAFGEHYEPLQAKRGQVTPEPNVEFLWTTVPGKNSKVSGAARHAREREAEHIARRLRELLEAGESVIVDKHGQRRPVRRGDVAILFRALSDVQLYERALRDQGLDYYLVGGHAFYSQQEIYDVLNLLRAVASPADEIALAGVLRSPFFALEDETLFWLVESGGTLNDGLFATRLPEELAPEERRKATTAAATLAELRDRKDRVSIAALLELALARTAYDAALVAEFLGERKLANLQKLIEQARAADAASMDLADFITQLAEFTARETKEALAATLPEEADVVRLMTIHHAKGLEFPLVIVADLDRPEIAREPDAALDPALGPVINLSDDEKADGATGMELFRVCERLADAEERKRLLYVACTRAADYLILSSSLAGFDPDKLEGDWTALLAERFDLATGALIGPPSAELPRPQIRVTTREAAANAASPRSRGTDLADRVAEARAAADAGIDFNAAGVLPVPVDEAARRRFSVSRLSGRLVRDEDARAATVAKLAAKVPMALDPLAFGQLVHAALRRIDFRAPPPLGPWCEQLADELLLTNSATSAALASELLTRFVASDRWRQLAEADAVHRELEFVLAWPSGADARTGHYLQGYIDCLYHDTAGWHLVDYKTNDIGPAQVPATATDYQLQMAVYALAAERALGRPLAEIVLHFLRPGAEHVIAWDDAARRRAIDRVNAALAAVVGNGQRTTHNEPFGGT